MEYFKKGNITSGWRPIKSGKQYDYLINSDVKFKDDIIIEDGSVENTVNLMKIVVAKYHNDTIKLARFLKRATVRQTCDSIWNFLYHHIQYKLDARTVEQLRRPARAWAERAVGIDCDCFAIFVSSILVNLGIDHSFRITKYADSMTPDQFQHVYVIVPYNGAELVIDCVISEFNYQKPFSQKKDFKMSANLQGIDIAVLSGASDEEANLESAIFGIGVSGLGNNSDVEALKNHLIAVRKVAVDNPEIIAVGGEYPPAFIKKIDYALQHWDNAVMRDKALDVLAQNEDAFNKQFGLGLLEEPSRRTIWTSF